MYRIPRELQAIQTAGDPLWRKLKPIAFDTMLAMSCRTIAKALWEIREKRQDMATFLISEVLHARAGHVLQKSRLAEPVSEPEQEL